jgi:hypothetical protein
MNYNGNRRCGYERHINIHRSTRSVSTRDCYFSGVYIRFDECTGSAYAYECVRRCIGNFKLVISAYHWTET